MALLEEVTAILDLEQVERNLFRGHQPKDPRQRVFGGQVVGQALMAAYRTVDRPVHSLHGYFIRGGDPSIPIVYEVDRLRDGRSFSVRRVLAIQHGEAIFSMGCSFHAPESGLEHQVSMPEVPPPESLPDGEEVAHRLSEMVHPDLQPIFRAGQPVEIRAVDIEGFLSRRTKGQTLRHFWIRAPGRLPEIPNLHEALLAYVSDITLLDTALGVHGKSVFHPGVQPASLDHALWFHRPFRMDEWILFSQESPSGYGALGFTRGSFFTRDGTLIASVAQEGLIRIRR